MCDSESERAELEWSDSVLLSHIGYDTPEWGLLPHTTYDSHEWGSKSALKTQKSPDLIEIPISFKLCGVDSLDVLDVLAVLRAG